MKFLKRFWPVIVGLTIVGLPFALAQTMNSFSNSTPLDATLLNQNFARLQAAIHNIQGTDIVAGTITSTNIGASAILGTNIASGTITGTQIAGTTITGSNISNGAAIKPITMQNPPLLPKAIALVTGDNPWHNNSTTVKCDGTLAQGSCSGGQSQCFVNYQTPSTFFASVCRTAVGAYTVTLTTNRSDALYVVWAQRMDVTSASTPFIAAYSVGSFTVGIPTDGTFQLLFYDDDFDANGN